MASFPRYVQILQALQNIPGLEASSLHQRPRNPAGCYSWLMPCQDQETKEMIEKRLPPIFDADFDININFEHSEDDEKTV